MAWIRQNTRYAIYARDRWSCAYCSCWVLPPGWGLPDPMTATLDHVKPRAKQGSNEPKNLVTACMSCNSAKGALGSVAFGRWLVSQCRYPSQVRREVRNRVRRKISLYRAKGRAMVHIRREKLKQSQRDSFGLGCGCIIGDCIGEGSVFEI